jgi:UDP-N-acetylmuramyl tripeptide synthase
VHIIAEKWMHALKNITDKTTIILNADDPEIAFLGKSVKSRVLYFGLSAEHTGIGKEEHASDSTYCPKCGGKLHFSKRFFSHLGIWECLKCSLSRPAPDLSSFKPFPLPGTYNKYNTLAAALTVDATGLTHERISGALKNFKPAFGRQEIIEIENKKIQVFLSKNPTGFNESLRTIKDLGAEHVLIVLNDRIPDGRDVSWIWDVDFETLLTKDQHIYVSGDRVYDIALRLKYAHPVVTHIDTYPELQKGAIESALAHVPEHETLFILPTYSAMLEVRKILTGRKIL